MAIGAHARLTIYSRPVGTVGVFQTADLQALPIGVTAPVLTP